MKKRAPTPATGLPRAALRVMYAAVKAMSDSDIEDVFFAKSGPMDSNDVDSLRASTLKLIRQLAAGKSKPARLLGQVKRPGRPNKDMQYYAAVLTFWEARHKAQRGDKDDAAIKAVRAHHPEVKLSDASLKDTCMTLGRKYGWTDMADVCQVGHVWSSRSCA